MIGYLILGALALYAAKKLTVTPPGLTGTSMPVLGQGGNGGPAAMGANFQPMFAKPLVNMGPSVQGAQPQQEAARVVTVTKNIKWQPSSVITPDITPVWGNPYIGPAEINTDPSLIPAPGFEGGPIVPNGRIQPGRIVPTWGELGYDAPPAPMEPTLAPKVAVQDAGTNKPPLVDALFLMEMAL
jgi:hypothetical protein